MAERIGSLASSEELREAILAELMGEQLELTRSQRDVAALIDAADRRLTLTLKELRAENQHLRSLVLEAEGAFKGELALRSAEHARREFVEATAGAMERLAHRMQALERVVAPTRWRRLLEMAAVSGVTVLMGVGVMALLHR